jgi:hypothetical protein
MENVNNLYLDIYEYYTNDDITIEFNDIIIFRRNAALMYYDNENFREKVNKLKKDHNKKLCFEFERDNNIRRYNTYDFYDTTFDFSLFENAYSLTLQFLKSKLINIDKLVNLHILELYGIKIEDISMLGNIHTLILQHCENIINVNPLKNVHNLDLSNCTEIKDVSELKNVHTLNLEWCIEIEDVSALKNVHTLNLNTCIKVKDISALRNVYDLNLSCCKKIKDISMLINVHILHLNNCNKIKDIGELRKLIELRITTKIESIHLLKNLKKLYIKPKYNKGELNKLKKLNKKVEIIFI